MPEPAITNAETEKAILIGISNQQQNEKDVREFLNELEFLT